MKKIYSLLFIGASVIASAQNPVLTAVLDGPCSGGTPKILEIYASGTVDFTQFTLQNQTNANTDWAVGTSGSQTLEAFGTRTNEFVYVIMTNDNLAQATAEYPNITSANSLESGVMNLNGDDRVRIINTATTAVVDQFGVSDVDGTDSEWEWLDSWAKRVNGTGPDGAFVIGNWTFGGVNALDNTGLCTGAAALNTILPLGTFSLGVNQHAIAGLKIYPNPVSGSNFYISTNANATKDVAIFDVLGKQVMNTRIEGEAVNVSNLKSGVYIVKVTEEGKTATRKLVVK